MKKRKGEKSDMFQGEHKEGTDRLGVVEERIEQIAGYQTNHEGL